MSRSIVWKQDHTLEDLEAAYKQAVNKRHQQRIWAIWHLKQGKKADEVAESLAISTRSIYEWVKRYQTGGLLALFTPPPPGCPEKLPLTRPELQALIREGNFQKVEDIRQVLSERYQVAYTTSGVWYLLKRHRIKWKVGRRFHPQGNPEAQERFKKGG